MIELDNRAEAFLESIRAEGEQNCAAIRAETEATIEAALKKTRAEEKAKAAKTLAFEKVRAEAAANRALSEARASARAELSARRDALAAGVFAEAEKRLVAFAAGKEYAAWLQKSAAALAKQLGKGAVLYARKADMPLLENSLPAGVALKEDASIRLGGLKGEGKALAADDTLESRLAAQKDWFLEYSGLTVEL